jgi:hypothetical protein
MRVSKCKRLRKGHCRAVCETRSVQAGAGQRIHEADHSPLRTASSAECDRLHLRGKVASYRLADVEGKGFLLFRVDFHRRPDGGYYDGDHYL